jgi:hypothetical protein
MTASGAKADIDSEVVAAVIDRSCLSERQAAMKIPPPVLPDGSRPSRKNICLSEIEKL